jgi:hypothetical protein
MIPHAEGNYKIILRTAKAGMVVVPDKFWDLIKNNTLVTMTGAIVDDDHIDIESFARILSEGFANDEFNVVLDALGQEYRIYFKAEDVHALKNYIERS